MKRTTNSVCGSLLGTSHLINFIVNRMTGLLVSFALAFVCATSTYALGQKRYVEFTASPCAMRLGGYGVAAPIIVDSQDYPGVLPAAHDLQTDIERVTKIIPAF